MEHAIYKRLLGGLGGAIAIALIVPTSLPHSAEPAQTTIEADSLSYRSRRHRRPYRGGTGRREILSQARGTMTV